MEDILTLFIVFASGYVIFLTLIMVLFRLFFHGTTTTDGPEQFEPAHFDNRFIRVGDLRQQTLSGVDLPKAIKGMIRQQQ
jgi:hypothetical protein